MVCHSYAGLITLTKVPLRRPETFPTGGHFKRGWAGCAFMLLGPAPFLHATDRLNARLMRYTALPNGGYARSGAILRQETSRSDYLGQQAGLFHQGHFFSHMGGRPGILAFLVLPAANRHQNAL